MNATVKNLLRSCAVLLVCVILSLCSYFLYKDTKDYLPYRTSSLRHIAYDFTRPEWVNKQTIREKVNTLFRYTEYTIIETEMPYGINGELKSRKVFINKKVSLDMYAYTLTHELVHLNYKIKAERKTNLITWELLYFSNIEYFRNIALAYANSDAKGEVPYEYSILGYIEHYLI